MKRGLILGVLFTWVSLSPVDAPGCGPFFQVPDFIPVKRPGVTTNAFYNGKLGVISGDWLPRYQIAAWRRVSGKPLDATALQSMSRGPVKRESTSEGSGIAVWQDSRSAVMDDPAPEPIDYYRKAPGERSYQTYLNCPAHAFETAAETLLQRSKQFDAQQTAVWVRAQDVVFANCSEGNGIPADPEAGLPALLTADRQYQIASALFYAARFDDARAAFLRIAKDGSSPWKNWAPYLAARCLIRKAALLPIRGRDELQTAEEEMLVLARSSPDEHVKQSAQGLADHVASKLRPGDAMAQIANKLADPKHDAEFADHLADLEYIWKNRGVEKAVQVKSDLYDWILTIRGYKPVESTRALKNEALLLAVLMRAAPDSPDIPKLLEAARNVRPSSPAYPTVAYHTFRLTEKQLENSERRKQLDTALGNLRRTQPRSAWSPFLVKRMPLAVSFTEFLELAPRAPAALTSDYGPENDDWRADLPELLLDEDATRVFNELLPLNRWRQAAESNLLTPDLRNRLLRTAWARAVVLGDQAMAAGLAPKLGSRYPELKQLAKDTDAFAAVYLMLHTPGIQPFLVSGLDPSARTDEPRPVTQVDGYRRNWWCAGRPPTYGEQPLEKQPELRPVFLASAEYERGVKEHAQLKSAGTGPTFLGRRTVEWVAAHRDDPRAAKALHLVVRATRSGCSDEQTSTYSKRSFQMLHKLYPNSEWAKRTPYWYN